MPPKRPTSVTIIAVLQLVFGGLGVCGLIFGAVGQVINPQFGAGANNPQVEMQQTLEREVPGYAAVVWVSLAVGLVVVAIEILSGVGLLNMKPWGRTLAIVYAVCSIVQTIFGLVWNLVFVMPAMNKVADAFAAKGGAQAASVAQMMKITFVLTVGITAAIVIYPVIVLVVMMLPSVRRAFAGLPPEGQPEDYHDRYRPEEPAERDRPEDYDRPEGFSRPDDRYR